MRAESLDVFEGKMAVANISRINYYDPTRNTGIDCDASHCGLGTKLQQKSRDRERISIESA